MTHREPRIVARNGAGPDDDGRAKRPQTVQMAHVGGPGHVIGVARSRGDVAVEALAELPDRERPLGPSRADRHIEVQQRPDGRRRVRCRAKSVADPRHIRVPKRNTAPRGLRGRA